MPYSTPDGPVRAHRRSRASFTDEKGPGAFASLGTLPRRRSIGPSVTPPPQQPAASTSTPPSTVPSTPPPKKTPVFHLGGDDNDDDDDSPDDNIPPPTPPRESPGPQYQSPGFLPTLGLSVPPSQSSAQDQDTVPFPCSSPLSPSLQSLSGLSTPPRPSMSRRDSSPIMLSNGKPLKSSLKSSASAPHSLDALPSQHTRARSAPSTPALSSGHTTPKAVHFPGEGRLASVKVFSRSARPAAVSGNGEDTTDAEADPNPSDRGFPFPRVGASGPGAPPAWELDPSTSRIPAPAPHANVHIESLHLPKDGQEKLELSGTVLVRNIAFEKSVALRFTLDSWQTTSEVSARYAESVPCLPPALARTLQGGLTLGDVAGRSESWDRFTFNIRLEDYAHTLGSRVLWLVARYSSGGGVWWDNNEGRNFRVAFRAQRPPSPGGFQMSVPQLRQVSLSAPAPLAIPLSPRFKRLSPRSSPQQSRTPSPLPSPLPVTPSETPTPTPTPTLKIPFEAPRVGSPVPQPRPAEKPSSPQSIITSPTLRTKLNLANYSAPSTVSTMAAQIPLTPPDTPLSASPTESPQSTAKPLPKEPTSVPRAILGGHPATGLSPSHSPVSNSPASSASVSPSASYLSFGAGSASTAATSAMSGGGGTTATGISLHWPWGTTLKGSPPKGSPTPASPAHASPVRSGSNSPIAGLPGGEAVDSDSLYKAFVKQWCFAQSGPGSQGPGAQGSGAPGVLVG